MEQGVREGPAGAGSEDEDGITGGEQIDYDNLREQLIQAIRDGDESAMRDLARLAIVAFGRRGEGSGVLGVDVQRIRRALGLRSEPGGPVQGDGRRAAPAAADPRPDPALRAAPAPRARARADRAHAVAAALAAAERARSGAAERPAAGPRRRAPRRRAAQAPARHPGPRDARAQAATRTSTCAARCAPRCRPAACRSSSSTARGARSARSSTCCATSRPRSPARRCSSCSVLHALHDAFRKMRSFVFVERISEVTEVFERERSFSAVSDAISQGRRRGGRVAATPTTGACGASSSPRSPTTCTRARR